MKRMIGFLLLSVTACVLCSSSGKAQTPTTVQVKALVQGLWNGTVHKVSPVSVELRAGGATPVLSTLVGRMTGMMSTTGTITVNFPNLATGNYWVIVRHGGAVPISSITPQTITAGSLFSYDFSDAETKAYGQGTLAQVIGGTTYYVLKAGDLNGDRASNPLDIPIMLFQYPKSNASIVPAE